ncbi:MAG: hypothetical protein OXR07_02140 [Nitrospira sp.]|nr:hypothetical protein [Nitrospira sp.]MDD9860602.1 hypothetical protein [Nitrospira sp.]
MKNRRMNLRDRMPGHASRRVRSRAVGAVGLCGLGAVLIGVLGVGLPAFAGMTAGAADAVPSAYRSDAVQAVRTYVQAVSARDVARVAQNDFVCLMKMVESGVIQGEVFPSESDPVYAWCWDRMAQVHVEVIESRDRALDALWPGVGRLVNFRDFKRFEIAETRARQRAPSFFVMPEIGEIAQSRGFTLEVIDTSPFPHASFQSPASGQVVAVPTTLVRVRVAYPDPMTSPAANAAGQQDWVVPYKKPIHPVKAVTVKWVALSGLRQHGFPVDTAVLNIPMESAMGTPIPFVVDAGGFEQHSTEFWSADEAQAALDAGVERAKTLSTRRERISMLNRVLAVNPVHREGVQALASELYGGLMDFGAQTHGVQMERGPLYQAFNELYWTVQAQTDRMDISLHMEMGGKSDPTPADYLYRLVPVMETLVALAPQDFDTRLKLSRAYRWTNDQRMAIMAPQQLLAEVPTDRPLLRARILTTLAWSRISKVAWNRHFDDPDIVRGYEEADEAFQLSSEPLIKFSAAYAKAYSLAFRPQRDSQTMVALLKEAQHWYQQIAGATEPSWVFLLQNDTLKGLVETDPAFRSLVSAHS